MAPSAQGERMLSGIAAAAVALGAATLLAVPFGAAADPRLAVGSAVIDLTPGPVKQWAIEVFGFADKLALSVIVLVVLGLIAAFAAERETARRPIGSASIVAAGALGCAAVLSRAGGTATGLLPTIVGTAAGVAVLRWLVRRGDGAATNTRPARIAPDEAAPPESVDLGRRQSMTALAIVAVGVVGGVAGTLLSRRLHSVGAERAAVALTAPLPAAPIPAGVTPPARGVSTFITANADFYRIDTALTVPQLSRQQWQLRIHGMVDREVTLTFDDLAQLPSVEAVVTLTCVSNPVGGELVGNASWTGYPIRDLLARAGVHADADMVLSTSIDGFTAGTPIDVLTDDRDALLAVAMNGEPLPEEHGYPARLVVPGLYGYVSATKWVVDLEVTRFDRAEAYWTKLGWAERGPIKTQSRIDVPRDGGRVESGPVTVGGVAWAQHRGIRGVEVQIDDGEWRAAELGEAYSDDTWRLWSFTADVPSGRHTATVRATDGTGDRQTDEWVPPVPDGASGWHSVLFTVA